MNTKKIILLLVIALLIAGFFIFDLGQYFNLSYLKEKQGAIDNFYQQQPLLTIVIFFLTYVLFTGLSLPAASILTLAAGALFGVIVGTIIVSFASTLGATLAFLASRFLFRDLVQERFAERLALINQGVEKDGAFYLFTLRLVPIFPFFVINLVMGLTPIRVITYALVSQLGMLAATIIYVNAGTQLAKIDEIGDILSAELLISFALLGVFPLLARKIVQAVQQRQARLQGGTEIE